VRFSFYGHIVCTQAYVWTSIFPLKASSSSTEKYSNDCMDGWRTTTQSCFASPKKQSKDKFDLFQRHKVQWEEHFGTKK